MQKSIHARHIHPFYWWASRRLHLKIKNDHFQICPFSLPHVQSWWEKGRYMQYLFTRSETHRAAGTRIPSHWLICTSAAGLCCQPGSSYSVPTGIKALKTSCMHCCWAKWITLMITTYLNLMKKVSDWREKHYPQTHKHISMQCICRFQAWASSNIAMDSCFLVTNRKNN